MRNLKKTLLKSPLNCCLKEIPNDNLTKNENETNLLVKHKPKSSVQHLAKSFVKTDFSEDYIEAKCFENETNSITNNVYVYINSVVNETYALNCSVPKDVLNILLCYNEGIYPTKKELKLLLLWMLLLPISMNYVVLTCKKLSDCLSSTVCGIYFFAMETLRAIRARIRIGMKIDATSTIGNREGE